MAATTTVYCCGQVVEIASSKDKNKNKNKNKLYEGIVLLKSFVKKHF